MGIDLAGRDLTPRAVPCGYDFIGWEDSLLDAFARAKYLGFRNEIDASVFPCLADFDGCRRLMTEIVAKPGFLPGATWLAACRPDAKSSVPVWRRRSRDIASNERARPDYCGTVQGVRDQYGCGAIQNLSVAREHRHQGLGTALLLRALAGFQQAGVQRVYLEVTAQNQNAIRLYRRLGFFAKRVLYKTIETSCVM
ncbi:MAG: GNAT family N-acetyltransferase [Planctomycetaceae bacterium]|nr:GNAT family N-acetyltransferase [Planctomycetaceae bacterium]